MLSASHPDCTYATLKTERGQELVCFYSAAYQDKVELRRSSSKSILFTCGKQSRDGLADGQAVCVCVNLGSWYLSVVFPEV